MIDVTLAFHEARIHARRLGSGRLHRDECDSEAGYAVAKALKTYQPERAGFLTYVMRLVRWGVQKAIQLQARFVQCSDAWWGEIPDRGDSPTTGDSIERLDKLRRLVDGGASVRAVQKAAGCTRWQAWQLIRKWGAADVARAQV